MNVILIRLRSPTATQRHINDLPHMYMLFILAHAFTIIHTTLHNTTQHSTAHTRHDDHRTRSTHIRYVRSCLRQRCARRADGAKIIRTASRSLLALCAWLFYVYAATWHSHNARVHMWVVESTLECVGGSGGGKREGGCLESSWEPTCTVDSRAIFSRCSSAERIVSV